MAASSGNSISRPLLQILVALSAAGQSIDVLVQTVAGASSLRDVALKLAALSGSAVAGFWASWVVLSASVALVGISGLVLLREFHLVDGRVESRAANMERMAQPSSVPPGPRRQTQQWEAQSRQDVSPPNGGRRQVSGPVKAVLQVLNRWRIADILGAAILGSANDALVAGLRCGREILATRDMQDRARLLLDIYEGVYGLMKDPKAEQDWIRVLRDDLQGKSLLDLMTEGSQKNLIRALAFVDYVNGR